MIPTHGYAAMNAHTTPAPFDYEHRDPGPKDVVLDIQFCGICHSDIHTARAEWGQPLYPVVPGHEIVGTVAAVGNEVTKFKLGDRAAVGCMVDSCGECVACREDEEQFCDNPGTIFTYNSLGKDGRPTYGGYGNHITVTEDFVLRVPDNLDSAGAAPLLCAGITTYSPLKRFKVGPGKTVGVVGLGGLGHMALKFSHAFGAKTVLFTTSANKVEDGKRLGADEVILTREEGWTKPHARTFDIILDCVSAEHDVNQYLGLLKRDGVFCMVGAPEKPLAVSAFSVFAPRRNFTGSLIGGIAETQEMLDFCGEHNIVSDIEITSFNKLEEAWDRVVKADVKYRFVLDHKTLRG